MAQLWTSQLRQPQNLVPDLASAMSVIQWPLHFHAFFTLSPESWLDKQPTRLCSWHRQCAGVRMMSQEQHDFYKVNSLTDLIAFPKSLKSQYPTDRSRLPHQLCTRNDEGKRRLVLTAQTTSTAR
jgi:hypothetical protein